MRSPYSLLESKAVITVTGLALIVLLGLIDYATGPTISFSIFYLLPISLLTWWTNRQTGMVAAFLSATVWLLADLATQTPSMDPLVLYWNAVVRFLVFAIIVYLESALKRFNQDLEAKVKDRTALLMAEINERKRIEARLQQSARRLEIMHDIDRAILAAQSLERIAETTIVHITDSGFCDRASLLLFDFAAQQGVIYDRTNGESTPDVRQRGVPIDARLNTLLASLQQHMAQSIQGSIETPPEPSVVDFLQSYDYGSLLVVPILVQHELVGSLNLMAHQPRVFSLEHSEMGRELANQLGIAFQQATTIDELRTSQENLQALSKRLLGVQEAERRKIARELHDEVGQALTGIGVMLDIAAHSETQVMDSRLKQVRALVVELMDRVRGLSLELRPNLLDDWGLIPTLVWHTNRYAAQTNIGVILKHSGLENRRFIPEIETAAYRIVQEALTNVARHASAREVKVTLWCDQNVLGIQVEDEGTGFEPEVVRAAGRSGGLLGMQERAALLHGKFTIESEPGSGTRVFAEIPVDTQAVTERSV